MTDTSATPAPKPGLDRNLVIAGVAIVLMGGVIVGLVRVIRSSPCFQHKDGPEPLIDVAKASAEVAGKLHLAERTLPEPTIPLVATVPSDEAPQVPDNGHVDTLPRVVPPTRHRPVREHGPA